jgi:23S rRNA U2552 (ribose-2'-O)-methylase RlmE/FtsJ
MKYVDASIDEILQSNKTLFNIVTMYKDKITEHYENKQWDRYKKLSNEYELIFYSANSSYNIASISPVSRSFFKLWEIIHDFASELGVHQPVPLKCVFLAEGPGGFFEAFYRYRKNMQHLHTHTHFQDEYHGITLKSQNKTIPDWKMSRRLPLHVSYGKDGTGNLYVLDNITSFANDVGPNTVDFITADGGFDFSSNFNNQEEQSFRLIVSEITSALILQKEGGSFLLKIFDCFNEETLRVLQVLYNHYTNIYMIKPLTSRPANSERYMLCTGFTKRSHEYYSQTLSTLTSLISSYDTQPVLEHLRNIPFDGSFLNNIVLYNVYYTMRQVLYIQRTINYIKYFSMSKDHSDVEKAIIDKHRTKSVKWCVKYDIPHKQHIECHDMHV